MEKKKKKNNLTPKKLFNWALTFTKRVILLITIIWIFSMIYSAAMITVAIFTIGNFSYLDTYITEMCQVFMVIVGANIVSKTIENVFRYNKKLGGESTYPDDIIGNTNIEEEI